MIRSIISGLARATALCLSCILGWTFGGPASAHREPGMAPVGTAAHPPKSAPHEPEPHAADPHGSGLSVASIGGGPQGLQQTALLVQFSKQSGIQVQLHGWDGSLSTLQVQVQGQAASGNSNTGNGGWDMVVMEDAPLRLACRQGIFLSRPLTRDPADTAPDSTGQDCGVPAWRMNLILAWDRSRVDMTPSWADFWDVARRPGKRGLRRDPRGTLEIALMADGVAPDDVYRTLATAEGVDRAFRKLDQLKPYIVWWNTSAEAVQIIDGGAVLMTSAPNDEVVSADQAGHRNFGTQWAQSLGIPVDWGVLRATTPERRAMAQRLLALLADHAHQQASSAAGAGPGAAAPQVAGDNPPQGGSQPEVPPSSTIQAPTRPSSVIPPRLPAQGGGADGPAGDRQQHATLLMDDGFWVDHLLPLRQRLDSWIERK